MGTHVSGCFTVKYSAKYRVDTIGVFMFPSSACDCTIWLLSSCTLCMRWFFGLSTLLTSGSFRFRPKHGFRIQLPQVLVIDGHTLLVHGGASRQKYSPVRKKYHGMPIPEV